jgi:hypothetical protein
MSERCEVPKCKNRGDVLYSVDPNKPKRVCSPCIGKHSPRKLDALLEVKQKDYGCELPLSESA